MYKNGYVLAIKANGNILDENSSRTVTLPFGTEYSVRLINKNYERCAADLIINGEKIARFIVNAGETTDIERYLDGNLNSGSRFKFTHLYDSKVKDAKDIDNGIIEVHFYKEAKKKEPLVIREEHHHHHWDLPWEKPREPKWPWPNNPIYYGNNISAVGSCKGMSTGASAESMSFNTCIYDTFTSAEGATVRGSISNQNFSEVSGLEFESNATILKIKIINGEVQVSNKYCSGCGRKKKDGDRFCSNCGTKI